MTLKRSPTHSTLDPAKHSAGAHLPKQSTNTYSYSNKPVLRPPIESSQYTAIRYHERLLEVGAIASIGTVGDSNDCDGRVNAMAESLIGLYKAECVRHDGLLKTVDDLELATLSWVHFSTTAVSKSPCGWSHQSNTSKPTALP